MPISSQVRMVDRSCRR